MQLTTCVAALQFSIAPWDVSKEAAALCAAALELRKKVALTPSLSAPQMPPLRDSLGRWNGTLR